MLILSCLLFVAHGPGLPSSAPRPMPLRRAFGVNGFSMQEEHISDTMLFQAADWEPIDPIIQQACWTRIGHVAGMHILALPELALLGLALFFQGCVEEKDARLLVDGGFGQDVSYS